jgi:hypothetical protein
MASTTIPKVIISANSDIMLMVNPHVLHQRNRAAHAGHTGIPAATQNAVRAFRNMNSQRRARKTQ